MRIGLLLVYIIGVVGSHQGILYFAASSINTALARFSFFLVRAASAQCRGHLQTFDATIATPLLPVGHPG